MMIFLSLFLSFSAAASETQISTSRVEGLSCTAVNVFGASTFRLDDEGRVRSLTNGFMPKDFHLSNLGNSQEYGFGYINLSAGRDIVSFAFPGQPVSSGQRTFSGVMFLNQVINPFLPVVGMGTPWAQVTCSLNVR